ncbi:hypothetical protein [Nonomuraea sp. NPDC049129]|uniref:hypothetical protein n=1 Tax=unclassified Nonomuraea TaxID=2593643 RepID=UPI0034025C80
MALEPAEVAGAETLAVAATTAGEAVEPALGVGDGTEVVPVTAAGVAVALPVAGVSAIDQAPMGPLVPPNVRVPVAPATLMTWSASALYANVEGGVRSVIPDGAVMSWTTSSAYRQMSHELAAVVVTDGATADAAADWAVTSVEEAAR